MKYLLDTHIILWWLNNDKKLSKPIKNLLVDPANDIYVSIASEWEISIKARLKKLPLKTNLKTVFQAIEFDFLPINLEHVLAAYKLPMRHKDPFDRMLVAQAQVENFTLVTNDQKIKKYKIKLANF